MNNKHNMKRALLATACMIAAICSYAQKTKTAVISSDKKTITFYYDEKDHSKEGSVYTVSDNVTIPEWYADYKTVTKAVFDKSFKDARPNNTAYWFAYMDFTDLSSMSAMTQIEGLENLNTSEADNFSCMFYNCASVKNIDLRNFNTSKVTNMASVFYNCASLESVDLSNFNTENVTNMAYMFEGCSALKKIDLTSFRTEKTTSTGKMFSKCKNLETIIASPAFDISEIKNSANMFAECENLVGGNGTTYDESATNKTYAKIDNGNGSPGYFTKPEMTVTIGETGYATLYNADKIDFEETDGFKAYTVSSYNSKTQTAMLVQVKNIPANTAVLIVGTPGTYNLKKCSKTAYTKSLLTGVYGNMMLPMTNGSYTNYILSEGEQGSAFYKTDEGGFFMRNGNAYLALPTATTVNAKAVKLFFDDEENDETTDISSVNNDGTSDNNLYNLAGQKVDGSYKGIVIRNGKKIMQ